MFTKKPGTLTNDFFVNLLEMDTEWKATSDAATTFEGRARGKGDVKWTASRVDLVFGSNSELRALAEVYALMVFHHEDRAEEKGFPPKAYAAWKAWYDSTPDTPCIAICSTSQGDDSCKGCGRTFEEVQRWPEMSPAEKRQTWRRITLESDAWRFNKYAERAAEGPLPTPAPAA